jgi:hypothetical protein
MGICAVSHGAALAFPAYAFTNFTKDDSFHERWDGVIMGVHGG